MERIGKGENNAQIERLDRRTTGGRTCPEDKLYFSFLLRADTRFRSGLSYRHKARSSSAEVQRGNQVGFTNVLPML